MIKKSRIKTTLQEVLSHSNLNDARAALEHLHRRLADASQRRDAYEEIQGFLDVAATDYYNDLLSQPNMDNHRHWVQTAKAALGGAAQENRGKLPRGYWFDRKQVEGILATVLEDSYMTAVIHLNPETRQGKVPFQPITFAELAAFAGFSWPPEWQ